MREKFGVMPGKNGKAEIRWQTEPGGMRMEAWSAEEGFLGGVVLDCAAFGEFVMTVNGFGGSGAFELKTPAEYGVPKFVRGPRPIQEAKR
jgi:hypothetical protein